MGDDRSRVAVLEMPRVGSPPVPRVPRAERWELGTGLRVAAVGRPGLPQVAMRLIVPAGSAADPVRYPGTAALVGSLLSEGTERLSAEELNTRLDLLGASLSVQVGHDHVEVDLVLLSETLEEGLELLAEVIARPAFAPRELERTRAETLDALEARADEPANLADDLAAEAVFGPDHPYGRLTAGSPEGVAAVPREVLAEFHAARYRPRGSVLVIAGDLDPQALPALLERAFGDWEGTAPPLAYPTPPVRPAALGPISVAWPEAAQAEIRFAGLGIPRSSPVWVPSSVANYLLGGSTITGRLGTNLREDKGWTYGVRSGFAAALQPGGWVVETAVDDEVAAAAVAEIRGELERFASEPVSPAELRRAKQALILSLPRAFETPGRIVSRIAAVEAFDLGTDYWDRFPERVEAVSIADVLSVAREQFDPARLAWVVVGSGEAPS